MHAPATKAIQPLARLKPRNMSRPKQVKDTPTSRKPAVLIVVSSTSRTGPTVSAQGRVQSRDGEDVKQTDQNGAYPGGQEQPGTVELVVVELVVLISGSCSTLSLF
ncbi:MAG: hypothetical protein LH624_14305 [Cryobacterium sp.]|nr:hypothetical protein [Cryobacterium sp.]